MPSPVSCPVPSQPWSHLTTTDFARLDPDRTIAVLPVSACEQHGAHLPLSTDAVINAGVIKQALNSFDSSVTVLILPAQEIGDSIEHTDFPGTLTAEFDDLVRSWLAIGESVSRAGVSKMLIFNTHGGQRGHVDQAAIRLRARHNMLVARVNGSALGLPPALINDTEQRFGFHGGEIETSMMLHLAPELVRREHLAHYRSAGEKLAAANQVLGAEKPAGFGWMAQDLNPHGVTGNAANASAANGRLIVQHMAERLALLCLELANTKTDLLTNKAITD